MELINQEELTEISKVLLANRSEDRSGWYWISDAGLKTLDKKRANKYLLACILDYQMKYARAWDNARRLAESILGDPPSLWQTITEIPFSTWRQKFKEYSLHRFPVAHERIWTIGKRVVDAYAGDARQLWKGLSPADATAALIDLGVGEQLSKDGCWRPVRLRLAEGQVGYKGGCSREAGDWQNLPRSTRDG